MLTSSLYRELVSPRVTAFVDPASARVSYCLFDPVSRDAAVIDPVLGGDVQISRHGINALAPLRRYLREHHLRLRWIVETEVHLAHVSGAWALQAEFGGQTAISAHAQQTVACLQQLPVLAEVCAVDLARFDRLLHERESLALGALELSVMELPGISRAAIALRAGDALLPGRALVRWEQAAARPHCLGATPRQWYRSLHRVRALPENTQIYPGVRDAADPLSAEGALVLSQLIQNDVWGIGKLSEAAFMRCRGVDTAPRALAAEEWCMLSRNLPAAAAKPLSVQVV